MYKITNVAVTKGYTLELTFDTGEKGFVDLTPLAGKGVFRLWDDMNAFRSVQIGQQGELAWGEDIDLCPDALYLEATGKRPEDVFPAIQRERAHA